MKVFLPLIAMIVSVAACDTSATNEDNGLSGYWSFNDEFTVDNSGNGNDAISHGAQVDGGVIGSAANLMGSGYIEIPDNGSFESYDRSFSIWINKSTASIRSGFEAIAWKGPEAGADVAFSLSLVNTEPPFKVALSAGDGASATTHVESDSLIMPGSWYHILAVVSPLDVTLYINGDVAGRTVNNGGVARNNDAILLGRVTESASTARYFNGRVDEVRFYDRALEGRDAQLLYTDGL
ncbi:MAG: LamG domain-containing protein [Rhodothermales bacterium]|nr:LamG domain-containing protein [Rhodothermales bacterium]